MKRFSKKEQKPVHDLHRKDDHMHTIEVFHDLLPILVIIIVFLVIIGVASVYGHSEANTYEHLDQIVVIKVVWRGLV